jgi:hypothetical protein
MQFVCVIVEEHTDVRLIEIFAEIHNERIDDNEYVQLQYQFAFRWRVVWMEPMIPPALRFCGRRWHFG